ALRHFFASALISGGASVKVVSERLGHASAAMTLNVYAGLWASDEELSRTVVDEALKIVRTTRGLREEVSSETAGERGVSG
ncbi:MAG TPA: tyrosine-type recombinase/integrase, partial [Kineosporiaceae bacterium]|nr:tyrosine-type recombinase/integrase [Kineosporiaceae bacterium]